MKEVNELLKQIADGNPKPICFLDGEEPYYVDLLVEAFENNILQEHEKDFNFKVFFGKDSHWNEIVNECRSFPVFASRRLVILKEAAQLKDLEMLEAYIRNPAETTLLVIAHKYKKADGRSALANYMKSKEAAAKVTYLTFDKLKEHQVAEWILQYCLRNQIRINGVNADLLADYLGNDLQKIVNEISKVRINMAAGEEITEELIERHIGISKDYNVFQFPKAIIERNTDMVFRIVHYYIANPKEGPMVVLTAMLYSEFCKLYRYHYAKSLPQAEAAKAVGIAPFFLKDYQRAGQVYTLPQTISAIDIIHQYNLHAVGVNIADNNMQMLKELAFKLLSL